jgi:glutaredoxin 3
VKVEIYSTPNCGYCKMAKQLAEGKGLDVDYKMMGEEFTPTEFREAFPTARTFPQIIVDGEKIGGYTDLEKLLNEST